MADESKRVELNHIDAAAADVLLQAVSSVGDDAQVAVIVRNKDGEFLIKANLGYQGLDWMLRQAQHAILSASLGGGSKSSEEEGEDASE
jgi:hypothetical protein